MTALEFVALEVEGVLIAPNGHHWQVISKHHTRVTLRRRGGATIVRALHELKDWKVED
jgi:hypothetical protein